MGNPDSKSFYNATPEYATYYLVCITKSLCRSAAPSVEKNNVSLPLHLSRIKLIPKKSCADGSTQSFLT